MKIGFGYRTAETETAHEARSGTPTTMALTGLSIWVVQQYLINPAPMPVVIAMWTLIPAAVSWVATHITVKKITL
jgi:hypothetical protein